MLNTLNIFVRGKETKDYDGMFDTEYSVAWMEKPFNAPGAPSFLNSFIVMNNETYHCSLPDSASKRAGQNLKFRVLVLNEESRFLQILLSVICGSSFWNKAKYTSDLSSKLWHWNEVMKPFFSSASSFKCRADQTCLGKFQARSGQTVYHKLYLRTYP